MERDERRRADALDRYWDAALRGDTPPRPKEVDEVAAALVARLGERRAPPAEARQRVRRQLIESAGAVKGAGQGRALPRSDGAAGERTAPRWPMARPLPPPGRRRRTRLATAALLLLTIALGYWAFGPDRADQPGRIPALDAPATPAQATPAPVAPDETLVEVEIPAGALPPGLAGAAFDDNTLRPGLRTTWTVRQDLHLRYVRTGTLTVRADGPVRVQRAGTRTWEEIAAGAEVNLGPGDAVLLLDVATAEFANLGAGPVELVGMILAAGTDPANPTPGEWVTRDYQLSEPGGVSLPGGPLVLRLKRVALAPEAILPRAPTAIVQFGLTAPKNAAGTPTASDVARRSDGSLANFGDEATVYVAALEATGGPPGSPAPGGSTP